jgi:hypothetical protein
MYVVYKDIDLTEREFLPTNVYCDTRFPRFIAYTHQDSRKAACEAIHSSTALNLNIA